MFLEGKLVGSALVVEESEENFSLEREENGAPRSRCRIVRLDAPW